MEVESFGRGYLERILVAPEQVVPVGTLIATLSDQPPGTDAPVAAQEEPAAQPASPRARRVAQELNVDIAAVKPANGKRITEEDVRLFHETYNISVPKPASIPASKQTDGLTAARKITARRMTSSFQSAPHFYVGVEANAAELVKLRETLVQHVTTRFEVKLTYTDFFVKAMAVAFSEQPHVNEYWRDGEVVRNESIDIGFAAQTDNGLLVPVIRTTGRLSLFELARERAALTAKARAGRLSLAEMEGGSATLSNLGHVGIDWFQAILNPPQSVILATGRIAKRPIVVNDQIYVQPTVALNLSADHRVVDGVAAANFLARIRELLESPSLLLV
jgi:pyruvate dehydrogenase E2 component (dihydrolipoamide acetyltransferase)